MKSTNIGSIVTTLMKELEMSEADLSRQTGIPTATLNRLLAGATPDPRISTLRPLANFFNTTIDQLLGDMPLTKDLSKNPKGKNINHVPLIPWEKAPEWNILSDFKASDKWDNWITTNVDTNVSTFATKLQHRSFEPRFPIGTILVIDPNTTPQHNNYLLVHHIPTKSIAFKQLLIDGKDQWLKPIHENIHASLLDSSYQICGVIIEAQSPFSKD